jgi:hypothetical protein
MKEPNLMIFSNSDAGNGNAGCPESSVRPPGNSRQLLTEEERREVRQRQREDSIRYRSMALREKDKDPALAEIHRLISVAVPVMVRAEAERIRAELVNLVEETVHRILADELPEAIDFLHTCKEASQNGQPAQTVGG